MGPNEQNQHFAKLRQKVCLYVHVVVIQRGLPSLDGKLERFVPKKWKKRLPNSSQTDHRGTNGPSLEDTAHVIDMLVWNPGYCLLRFS